MPREAKIPADGRQQGKAKSFAPECLFTRTENGETGKATLFPLTCGGEAWTLTYSHICRRNCHRLNLSLYSPRFNASFIHQDYSTGKREQSRVSAQIIQFFRAKNNSGLSLSAKRQKTIRIYLIFLCPGTPEHHDQRTDQHSDKEVADPVYGVPRQSRDDPCNRPLKIQAEEQRLRRRV